MPPAKGRAAAAKKKKDDAKSKTAQSSPINKCIKKEQGSVEAIPSSDLPLDQQQRLLNVFVHAFPDAVHSHLSTSLQEVKGHLYNRDFLKAFEKQEYLEAYALRWSPSRALAYADIFKYLVPLLNETEEKRDSGCHGIVCLGAGAGAELVGLAGALALPGHSSEHVEQDGLGSLGLSIEAVDIADWNLIVKSLSSAITSLPPLSAYASAAARAANEALVQPSRFSVSFTRTDVLDLGTGSNKWPDSLRTARLVTLMFTLNELYSTSVSRTQAFLRQFTQVVPRNCLFLVVDSPGSYSTVTLNGSEKKYPMHWLLDYTLLPRNDETRDREEGDENAGQVNWEKLKSIESRWFRVPEALKYPIPLENMRYQLHLYRRTANGSHK